MYIKITNYASSGSLGKGKRRQCGFFFSGMIKQFLRDVDWGEVDYLIVDTPPGTSDEHLSAVQYLAAAHIDGAVIITTPQVSECPHGAGSKPHGVGPFLPHRAETLGSEQIPRTHALKQTLVGSADTLFIFGPDIFG